MAGTDRTKADAASQPAPVVILVEPQMAENIGMAARAMANFGLTELRLVSPRDGRPEKTGKKKGAHQAASGAAHIIEAATIYPDTRSAIADLNIVYATTARERGQMKRVLTPDVSSPEMVTRIGQGERVGILFGKERTGLSNDDVSLADAIVTFPVNPAFASLNLAQAVLLTGYEWFKAATGGAAPFTGEATSPPAKREAVTSFFDFLEESLGEAGFFPPDKRPIMVRNLRDIFHRLAMTEQDVRTLRGAFVAMVTGRKSGTSPERHLTRHGGAKPEEDASEDASGA